MKLIAIPLLLCLQLTTSCATTDWHGFQAAVSVELKGADQAVVESAKTELIAYVEGLGLEVAEMPHLVEKPEFTHYSHPRHNVVFYNLYLDDPNQLRIIIRDARRTYSTSEELRKEVKGLLNILKKKFGGDQVKFEQQSTFLS